MAVVKNGNASMSSSHPEFEKRKNFRNKFQVVFDYNQQVMKEKYLSYSFVYLLELSLSLLMKI